MQALEIKDRITGSIADLREKRKTEVSRSVVVEKLLEDLSSYYAFSPFLVSKLFDLYNVSVLDFIESNENEQPQVVRFNTLKKIEKLEEVLERKGIELDQLAWIDYAYNYTSSTYAIGATDEYLLGYYQVQSPSSLLPVLALGPQPGECILDACAAPGVKSSHIAQLMENRGTLYANDLNPEKLSALSANLNRLGVKNAVVTNFDGRKLCGQLRSIDRVLLDAPCSGTGVIYRDASAKSRTYEEVCTLSRTQKELLTAAVDLVARKGGVVVYSTCSILVEENEMVVNRVLLKRKNAKLVDTGLLVGDNGYSSFKGAVFNPSLKLCKRVSYHAHGLPGFFVAKIVVQKTREKKEKFDDDVTDKRKNVKRFDKENNRREKESRDKKENDRKKNDSNENNLKKKVDDSKRDSKRDSKKVKR